MNKRFSIIFQGLIGYESLENIIASTKFTDDVIVSTWEGSISSKLRTHLREAGVIIVESVDPGSSIAYREKNSSRIFNINRIGIGLIAGANMARHPIIVKCRPDVSVDFGKLISLYGESGREFGSVNVTSVCPSRLLGPPLFCCISDWVVVAPAKCVRELNVRHFEESHYLCDPFPMRPNFIWSSRLCAEQVLCLSLAGYDPTDESFTNIDHIGLKGAWQNVRSKYLNINRDIVKLRSTKYRARAYRWLMFEKPFFEDDSVLKARIWELIFFIVFSLKRW